MKNIYHIHQSSNSYWDNHWTDTDYYLCDSEEEYQQKLAEYTEERKQIEKDFKENPTEANKYRALFFQLSKEQKVHANEYYYAHEWCVKEFDAFGFCWSKRLERSTHYKYFLKPGSVTNESVSSAVGRFTGYGS
jgi:hypothetical protein|nr:MAG TPA: hypothetical protein [Caudoviricetes sp.]